MLHLSYTPVLLVELVASFVLSNYLHHLTILALMVLRYRQAAPSSGQNTRKTARHRKRSPRPASAVPSLPSLHRKSPHRNMSETIIAPENRVPNTHALVRHNRNRNSSSITRQTVSMQPQITS